MVAGSPIVVFTTDHGDMMGQKDRVSKMVSYEGSARVPFLIRMPGVIVPNQKSDILINHVEEFLYSDETNIAFF